MRSLLLYLLFAGVAQLSQAQPGHQYEEDDCFGLGDALGGAAGGVEGVEDVQGQHLGGLDGGAAGLDDEGLAAGEGQVFYALF